MAISERAAAAEGIKIGASNWEFGTGRVIDLCPSCSG
jgi:hypothetical protein